jgi:hypothetical protein
MFRIGGSRPKSKKAELFIVLPEKPCRSTSCHVSVIISLSSNVSLTGSDFVLHATVFFNRFTDLIPTSIFKAANRGPVAVRTQHRLAYKGIVKMMKVDPRALRY